MGSLPLSNVPSSSGDPSCCYACTSFGCKAYTTRPWRVRVGDHNLYIDYDTSLMLCVVSCLSLASKGGALSLLCPFRHARYSILSGTPFSSPCQYSVQNCSIILHYFENAKLSIFENPDQVRTKFIGTWYLSDRYRIASTQVLDAWYLIKVREACL